MNEIHYLDNSATTPPCKEAVEALKLSMEENWGNPSSLYSLGMNAEDILIFCKNTIAKKLSSRADEIYFTASGTEANNLAIQGAILSRAKRGKRIVTTSIEHPSVFETVKSFESKGFEILYLKPDGNGIIPEDEISKAITSDTIFVSIMLVNNETGAMQPVKAAADAIKAVGAPALLHTDAVQAFGKLDIKPSSLGVDLLTASGHKIHAPKGIGFLYVKKGIHITPIIYGGGQQNGVRPGTEPTHLIAALEGAVKALPETKDALLKMSELRNYAKDKLKNCDFIRINSADDSLPFIINFSVLGYRSETLLHFLEAKNIFVSSGSACSKGELSRTLTSMGLSKDRVDSALRISFSRFSKKEDIDALVEALMLAVSKLKRNN